MFIVWNGMLFNMFEVVVYSEHPAVFTKARQVYREGNRHWGEIALPLADAEQLLPMD